MTMREVGKRLGLTSTTVSKALHAAKSPVRPGADAGRTPRKSPEPRSTICTPTPTSSRHYAVTTPRSQTRPNWHVTGPIQTWVPLPVPEPLLRELHVDIGLSTHHIALLIGLDDMATRNRLIQASVPFRQSGGRCPWNRRRYASD